MESISMKDLHDRLSKLGQKEVILDVRTPEEFQEAHIHGAINIPHEEVGSHIDQLKAYERVYIHCRSGGRATRAAQALQNLGLTNLVCISGSGMKDWLEAGYPTEN